MDTGEVLSRYNGIDRVTMELVRVDGETVVLGRNQAVRMLLAGTLVDPFRYQQACWQRDGEQ